MKAIYFDMDGTIANLYGVDGWLEKILNEDVSPYYQAAPIVNIEKFNALLDRFQQNNIILGIISWGVIGGSAKNTREVKKAKKSWVRKFHPALMQEFHVVKHGTPKHQVAKEKDAILVDDDAKVRAAWRGKTIDATKDIILALEQLLAEIEDVEKM